MMKMDRYVILGSHKDTKRVLVSLNSKIEIIAANFDEAFDISRKWLQEGTVTLRDSHMPLDDVDDLPQGGC